LLVGASIVSFASTAPRVSWPQAAAQIWLALRLRMEIASEDE
jgi:hypothetical protein